MNPIIIDFSNLKAMREVMKNYHHIDSDLLGKSSDGELTLTAIYEDHIIHTTYQNNHWIRKNILHWDGTIEELFEGKWEE